LWEVGQKKLKEITQRPSIPPHVSETLGESGTSTRGQKEGNRRGKGSVSLLRRALGLHVSTDCSWRGGEGRCHTGVGGANSPWGGVCWCVGGGGSWLGQKGVLAGKEKGRNPGAEKRLRCETGEQRHRGGKRRNREITLGHLRKSSALEGLKDGLRRRSRGR